MGTMNPSLAGTPLSPEVVSETTHRLSKARATLIRYNPFFATLALGMDIHITNGVPTAATTYTDMYFSPDFIKKLSDPEVVFLVCHEVMHPMLNHNTRTANRDKTLWNVAADCVINQFINDDDELGKRGVAKMPSGAVFLPDIYRQGEGTTEGVYRVLEKLKDQQDNNQGGGKQGSSARGNGQGIPDEAPWDDLLNDSSLSPAERAEQEQDMSMRVAQAANAAKMAGKLSAGLKRLVVDILEPKLDWCEVLRNFVFKSRNDDRSWARPNRRFVQNGVFMPSVSGEQMGEIVVAVDCSGSIGTRELDEFAAEIKAIHEDTCPVKLHVVYFDARVLHHDQYERYDDVRIEPHGGGGTAFSPIFRYVEANGIDPVCCVVLTDLHCYDFGPPPEYPVLWITNGTDSAPWGQVVKM